MIHVNGVNKIFSPGKPQAFEALKDIDFHLAPGAFAILNGISGSGKSTLLGLIGALDKPTSGEILVNGQPVAKLPDLHASHFRASTLGFVFQTFHLFDELDVASNVAMPLVPLGISQKEIDRKCRQALEQANIFHKAAQKVRDLSGGEKQRCVIARALVNDPALILMDEPTANLDRANSNQLIDMLRMLKGLGKTILLATHDPLFNDLDIVDHRIHIEAGRITP
jgi:putative ABC transport system ATP-binding protein